MPILTLATEQDYQAIVKESKLPILVDFSAKGCAQCRQLKPRLESLSEEYRGRVAFVEVDTDSAPEIAAQESNKGATSNSFL